MNQLYFCKQPDGNSVEAVHHREPRGGQNRIDHLWIRVRDLDASRRFYEAVAPLVGLRVKDGSANRFHVAGAGRSFALVRDDQCRFSDVWGSATCALIAHIPWGRSVGGTDCPDCLDSDHVR